MLPNFAMAKTWGLGAVVGSPTGLSVNYFLNETHTIHTTLAYNLSGDKDLELGSHYTWRKNDLNIDSLKLGWFYGAGAMLTFRDHDNNNSRNHNDNHDDDIDLGPSGTIGLFHEFTEVPLELFLKGNLTLNLIGNTDVDGDAMIGLHYNF
jgi:hypothetical protein